MSEDSNNNKQRPPNQPDRFQPKVLIIWIAIAAAMALLYIMNEPAAKRGSEEWGIQKIINATVEGRIESGVIKPDTRGGFNYSSITAKLKDPKEGEPVQVTAQGRLTDDRLETLQSSGVFKEVPASTFLGDVILTLLPILVIVLVLYFLFVRQFKNASKGAMSFGKSKAKMLTRDRERVLFKDVAGCEEAKEEVSEIVHFLRDPKKFQRIGGRIPKGVLLVGPPGTGKTLIARAVAGEAEVPFFSISGSDFVEMFVGVGAARVRDMFDQGRKSAPCIIFIDEIDAVGRSRGAGVGGGNDEREQTLNSLLVEMDGFDGHEGVIIIAATNRPDVLDSALLRPGRFDRQIVIDLPDVNGREEILKVHAKKIKVSKELDLNVIARNTPGFSGADLANLLNEAALLAARYDRKEVTQEVVDEARDKISYGRERRKLMDEEDKRITAYHEAGHALIQSVVDDGNLPVHKVTIIPRGQSLGSTMFVPKKDMLNHSKKRVINQICCAMGGRVAEAVVFDEITSGASGDIRMATKLARHMVCDWGMSELGMIAYGENQEHVFLGKEISRSQNYSEETARKIDEAIRQIVDEQYDRAMKIITEKRDKLDGIAQALLDYETIDGKHVHEILEYGEIRTPIIQSTPSAPKDSKTEEKEKSKKRNPGEELGPGTEPAGIPA